MKIRNNGVKLLNGWVRDTKETSIYLMILKFDLWKKKFFDNENRGKVENIHQINYLGEVIKKCSINTENFVDNDGSWGTCMIGCNKNPPEDVAHLQFESKIAFKLIWLPPHYDKFVLVDDDGNILKNGENLDKNFPDKFQRKMNFEIVNGPSSKYTKKLSNII